MQRIEDPKKEFGGRVKKNMIQNKKITWKGNLNKTSDKTHEIYKITNKNKGV